MLVNNAHPNPIIVEFICEKCQMHNDFKISTDDVAVSRKKGIADYLSWKGKCNYCNEVTEVIILYI